jgi:hypothetical protein
MQNEFQNQKDFLKVALLLLCITLLYFFPVIFSNQTFASRDLYAFFYPRRFFAAEAIRSGILPLWNPHLASGVPFLANLQSSLFYPLSVIYYLLPFHIGFKFFIILHYYLAGLFMYLLMKHLRYETSSSITAGIVFMFGGYLISILDNVAFLTAAVWLPLIVLFFDRSLRWQKPFDLIVTGVLIGAQILGGDASCYLLSTLIFMFAYLIYFLIAEKDFIPVRKRKSLILNLPVSWIIGLGLSSIQLIPFIEFVFHSTRTGGFGYESLTKWSFNPLELFQLLVPFLFGTTVPMCRWFGQYWLDTFYIGIFPLLLVVFCIFWSKCKLNRLLLLIVCISLFMALGKYNPLFFLFTSVPGINMLHYPVKYLFLAGFALSLLAGIGFNSLFAGFKKGMQIKGFYLFLVSANMLVLAVLFAGLILDDKLFELFKVIYPQTLFHKIAGVGSGYHAIFRGYSGFVILFISSSMLLAFAMRGIIPVKIAKVICIGIILADLMFVGKPADTLIDSSLYTKPSETVKTLKEDQSHFRIFSLSYVSFKGFMHIPNTPFSRTFETLQSFLTPNLSLIFNIDTIDEYAALLMRRYYDLFNPAREFFRLEEKEPWQMEYCKEILSILNVKYVISSFGLNDKDFKLVRDGKIKLYENLMALPRAYRVPDVTVVKDDAEALLTLGNRHFNPRKSVLITGEEYERVADNINKSKVLSPDNDKGDVKILKYSLNNVEIETSGNDTGWLVLADNYYPGWKTSVDGSKKEILRVNYNLRGVIVPPGKHRVQFRFDPLSFKLGAALSLFTLVIGIVFFFRKRILSSIKAGENNHLIL